MEFKPTLDWFRAYCERFEQQVRIVAIVKMVNKQGITQLFIKPQKVVELVKEFQYESIIAPDYNMDQFSDEALDNALASFLTKKIAEHMDKYGNISEESACDKAFNEIVISLAISPNTAHVLFSWITEFVFSYKEEMCNNLEKLKHTLADYEEGMAGYRIPHDFIVGTWDYNERTIAKLNELYEEALPCGMLYQLQELKWRNSRDIDFETFDITGLLAKMPTDRYYSVVFKGVPTYENCVSEVARSMRYASISWKHFRRREDIEKDIHEAFKNVVYDYIKNSFVDPYDFYETDLSQYILKMYKDRPIFVCAMYLVSMMHVNYTECQRLERLLKSSN